MKLQRMDTKCYAVVVRSTIDQGFCVVWTVASLRLVSTRAATDGVTYFSFKKLATFFSHDLFSCRLVRTPTFQRRLCTVLSKFSHKKLISFGCHSPHGVTRGAVPPVMPSEWSCSRTSTASWIMRLVELTASLSDFLTAERSSLSVALPDASLCRVSAICDSVLIMPDFILMAAACLFASSLPDVSVFGSGFSF